MCVTWDLLSTPPAPAEHPPQPILPAAVLQALQQLSGLPSGSLQYMQGSLALRGQHSSCSLTNTQYRGRITSLELLAILCPMHPQTPLTPLPVRSCCWLMFNLVSTRAPRAISAEPLSSWVSPRLGAWGCGCRGAEEAVTASIASPQAVPVNQGWCNQEPKAKVRNQGCVGAGISILQGIPRFCSRLLVCVGWKPTSFGNSYQTKLSKDEQILWCLSKCLLSFQQLSRFFT